jgi:hypothetical protein
VARHRRPVNVRDDGLPAVLGPLITAGGIELAVLLDVDSGMVLDAWARGGEAETSDAEALGARHADVVRALLALAGAPPAELALTVNGRHHLVRCVADPAGGRLALAVVVVGTPWVVRRARRHLRQLPDAGLTTGPWILSWAIGPRPASKPVAGRASTDSGPMPTGVLSSTVDRQPPVDSALGTLSAVAVGDLVGHVSTLGLSAATLAGDAADPVSTLGLSAAMLAGDAADSGPNPGAAESGALGRPLRAPDPSSVGGPVPAESTADDPESETPAGATAGVPDPRRGPAPPSALPPARSAGR